MLNCEVCGTEYVERQLEFCSKCGWILTLNSLTVTQSPGPFEQRHNLLEKVLYWAKSKQKELEKLESQKQELIQQLGHCKSKFQEASQNLSQLTSKVQIVNPENEAINRRLKELERGHKDIFAWAENQNKLWEQVGQHFNELKKEQKALDEIVNSKLIDELSQQRQDNDQTLIAIEEKIEGFKVILEEKNTAVRNLNKKIEQIVNYLNLNTANSHLTTPTTEYSLGRVTAQDTHQETHSVTTQTQYNNQDIPLTYEEDKIINLYQNDKEALFSSVIQVNATGESINNNRLGGQDIFLTKIPSGNYWIVNEGGFSYLVPKKNLTINQYSYNTAEALFECRKYQQGRSQKFKLLKPAKVFELPEGEKWRLDGKGILDFN